MEDDTLELENISPGEFISVDPVHLTGGTITVYGGSSYVGKAPIPTEQPAPEPHIENLARHICRSRINLSLSIDLPPHSYEPYLLNIKSEVEEGIIEDVIDDYWLSFVDEAKRMVELVDDSKNPVTEETDEEEAEGWNT
jgi:hypothetical protein